MRDGGNVRCAPLPSPSPHGRGKGNAHATAFSVASCAAAVLGAAVAAGCSFGCCRFLGVGRSPTLLPQEVVKVGGMDGLEWEQTRSWLARYLLELGQASRLVRGLHPSGWVQNPGMYCGWKRRGAS